MNHWQDAKCHTWVLHASFESFETSAARPSSEVIAAPASESTSGENTWGIDGKG